MIAYILLAFVNGVFISTSRAVNGQLSTEVGAFRASLWNHIVGFLFLTTVLAALSGWKFGVTPAPPLPAYLGGLFGAFFVAVSSHVFPRLGALNAGILVISGQMISAVLIDALHQRSAPSLSRDLGVIIVLLGVSLSRISEARNHK
jgi:bacterial/archaeal transporter family-2 protein